jgi:hypothetical protein
VSYEWDERKLALEPIPEITLDGAVIEQDRKLSVQTATDTTITADDCDYRFNSPARRPKMTVFWSCFPLDLAN